MKECIFTLEPVTINHPGRGGGEGWEDFRILSTVAGLCLHLEYRITFWYGCIVIPSCLAISNASYTKIFRPLSHLQTQVQDRVQQQPSQPNALNIARYGKAVHSALWVQLALVFCYIPRYVVEIVFIYSETYSSLLNAIRGTASVLIFFLNFFKPSPLLLED